MSRREPQRTVSMDKKQNAPLSDERGIHGVDRAPLVDHATPACQRSLTPVGLSLRHPGRSVYGCYLPVLTGFAVPPPRGPFPSTSRTAASPEAPDLEEEFNPAKAGCGFRAPPAPHLARSA